MRLAQLRSKLKHKERQLYSRSELNRSQSTYLTNSSKIPRDSKIMTRLPGMKILESFERRRDVAQETLGTEGRCPMEGKSKGLETRSPGRRIRRAAQKKKKGCFFRTAGTFTW